MKCYYEILGVESTATNEEIKRAYRRLALQYHPDKNFEQQEEAKTKFQEVGEAYETLIDPRERSSYDQRRRSSFFEPSYNRPRYEEEEEDEYRGNPFSFRTETGYARDPFSFMTETRYSRENESNELEEFESILNLISMFGSIIRMFDS